jgi:hypothetical protein
MLLAIFQDRDYSDVQVKRRQLTWNNIKKQTLKLEIDRNSKQKELIYLAIVLNDIQKKKAENILANSMAQREKRKIVINPTTIFQGFKIPCPHEIVKMNEIHF